MSMTVDTDTLIGFIGLTAGLIGIGYAIGTNRKMKDISETVGKSVDSIISEKKIDIPDDLINDVIREQVSEKFDAAVDKRVKKACDDIVLDAKTTMRNKIASAAENAVKSTYKAMEHEAKDQIEKELLCIDISDLKEEVKVEAKEAVAKKLESSMDEILETYNSNLVNIQTIYGSIAKAMSGNIG